MRFRCNHNFLLNIFIFSVTLSTSFNFPSTLLRSQCSALRRPWNRPATAATSRLVLPSFRHKEQQNAPLFSTPQVTLRDIDEVVVKNNQTETLLRLIDLGEQWFATKQSLELQNTPIDRLSSAHGYETVPGCMATVKVKVDLVPEKGMSSNKLINVNGIADSRVALGMLALLAKELDHKSIKEALDWCASISSSEIKSEGNPKVAQVNELRKLLPVGRLNGFDSMVNVIHNQLLKQVDNGDDNPYSSQATNSLNRQEKDDDRSDEIAVLLSGGVDSSVALAQLLQQGHKVRAYYLKIWLEDELAHLNQCPWEEDLEYATSVCKQLQVPLETLSLQKEYWQYVVTYTLQEAKQGRTPNPDIMCNSRIKFGMFYEYIGKYHKRIASGHYAQTVPMSDLDHLSDSLSQTLESKWGYSVDQLCSESEDFKKTLLRQSPDPIKDQSYFLCNLSQDQLQRCMFPIGHLQKEQVRQLAESYNLPTKYRKDSQGICFLGKLKFDEFIYHYLGEQYGEIQDFVTKEVLGKHRGLWFHTLGQRKGIGNLLNSNAIHRGPWFVAGKDIPNNVLFVTNNLSVVEAPRLTFTMLKKDFNWLLGEVPPVLLNNHQLPLLKNSLHGIKIRLKIRHSPTMYDATLTIKDDHSYRVVLDKKDKGIAPGQFAAIYESDLCLGAGVINTVG